MQTIASLIKELTPEIIAWRRFFHANPELGYEEWCTSEFIAKKLTEAGISPKTGVAKTGVAGLLNGEGQKTVALRADMDALPIMEETGLPFASQKKGIMHACGHDAHLAVVLGVAHVLVRLGRLPGNVKFIFQPCEERLPGGAKAMIDEGILEDPKVNAMFGLHVYPHLPVGVVGVKSGPIMAATDTFSVVIKGKGGHGAAPHRTVDPIVASAHIITALQTIVSRKINPVEPAVVTVGMIQAGERPNIIPQCAVFSGTVRSVNKETRILLKNEICALIKAIAASFHTEAEIEYQFGHAPLLNDEALTLKAENVIKQYFSEEAVRKLEYPSLAGEDFASYAELIPACYLFFGTQKNVGYDWHHPCFDIDEDVIPFAVEVLTRLVLNFLSD